MGSSPAPRAFRLAAYSALLAATLCAATLAGCGHQRGVLTRQPAASASSENVATPQTAAPETMEPSIAELECPTGVEPALWAQLQRALAEALRQAETLKDAAKAPADEKNRVTDFRIVAGSSGEGLARWTHRSEGDYDQNGEVGAGDLVAVGRFFLRDSKQPGWAEASVADGDGNYEVNLADVTVIGMNFGNVTSGYELQLSLTPSTESSWQHLSRVAVHDGAVPPGGGPRTMSVVVPDAQVGTSYRVVPYEADAAGLPSNYGIPSNIALFYGGSAGAGDWSMLGHDASHTNRSPFTGPAILALRWKTDYGMANSESARGSPVIGADGAVYTRLSYGIRALNPDGTERWRFTPYGCDAFGNPAVGQDGILYVSGEDYTLDREVLYALYPDGTVAWRQDAEETGSSVVLGEDSSIYTHTPTGLQCWSPGGELRWFAEFESLGHTYAAPTVAEDGTIYVCHKGLDPDYSANKDALAAFSSNGQMLWACALQSEVYVAPALGLDGTVFALTRYDGLYAFDPDGTLRWQFALDTWPPSTGGLAVGPDGSVYFGTHQPLGSEGYALAALDSEGAFKWIHPTRVGSSYRVGGTIVDAVGKVYFSDTRDGLYCLNPDGSEVWYFNTNPDPHSGDTGGARFALGDDGALYAVCVGEVFCFHEDGYGVPAPPTGVDASDGMYPDHVLVRWNRSPTATGYKVYRDGGSRPIAVLEDVTEYRDYAVPYYAYHGYTVSGTNILGEGSQSVPDTGYFKLSGSADTGPGDWAMYAHDARHTKRSGLVGPDERRLMWSYEHDAVVDDIGSVCQPVFGSASTIYVISKGGYLDALRPNGTRRWRYKAGEAAGAAAVGMDGTIYVSASHYREVLPGYETWAGSIVALNPNRTLKWTHPLNGAPRVLTLGPDGAVFCGDTSGYINALNPDGTLRWETPLSPSALAFNAPAVGPEGNIYCSVVIGIIQTTLCALDPSGESLWAVDSSLGRASGASPVVTPDGTIMVGGFPLLAITPDGTTLWEMFAANQLFVGPALDTDGSFLIGACTDYVVHGLGRFDSAGNLLRIMATEEVIRSEPILDAEGKAYCCDEGGRLYCFTADGNLAWDYRTGNETVYSFAIGNDGTLYAAGPSELLAFGKE